MKEFSVSSKSGQLYIKEQIDINVDLLNRVYNAIDSRDLSAFQNVMSSCSSSILSYMTIDGNNILHECLYRDFELGVHYMCEQSHPTLTSSLLNQQNRFGENSIHLASRLLKLNAIRNLIDLPIDIDIRSKDKTEKNLLHILLQRVKTHWNMASHLGRPLEPSPRALVNTVIAIISLDPNPSELLFLQDKLGFDCLDYALALNQLSVFTAMLEYLDKSSLETSLPRLLKSCILMNKYDLCYYLATKINSFPSSCSWVMPAEWLSLAIERQRDKALSSLLVFPLFVSALACTDGSGKLPLEVALHTLNSCKTNTSQSHLALTTIRYLQAKGASIWSALKLELVCNDHYLRCDNYFALAAHFGQVDVMRILLDSASDPVVAPKTLTRAGEFQVNHCIYLANPLTAAIRNSQLVCLEYMLIHTPFRSLVNQIDSSDGLTPLAAAAKNGLTSAVSLLLKCGADPLLPIPRLLSKSKHSALHHSSLVIESSVKLDLALEEAAGSGITSQTSYDAFLTLRSQISHVCARGRALCSSINDITMENKYTILSMGTTGKERHNIKMFFVHIVGALKAAKLFSTTKNLNISMDWAKVIFGTPSLFKTMRAMIEIFCAEIEESVRILHSRTGASISSIPLEDVVKHIDKAIDLERNQRSRWGMEIKSAQAKQLLIMMVNIGEWVKSAYLVLKREQSEETRVLINKASPLLNLHAACQEYRKTLNGWLQIPRSTLASSLAIKPLPKYGGFKLITSNATAIYSVLIDYAQTKDITFSAASFVSPSFTDHAKDWWWDAASNSDWDLLGALAPTIFRFENDPEALLCHAATIQGPPPSSLVLKFIRHGLVCGKSDALLYDCVRRVDSQSFLAILLTGMFGEERSCNENQGSTANHPGALWTKLRATMEWHMHNSEFKDLHSHSKGPQLQPTALGQQGLADLRVPAAPSSLDERATVIANILECCNANQQESESASEYCSRPLKRIVDGVLFCGLSAETARDSIHLTDAQTAQFNIIRHVWYCLSPCHRMGSVMCIETRDMPGGKSNDFAASILGVHGQVLPSSCCKWAFVQSYTCAMKNENVFDKNLLMGRFCAMPRAPTEILLSTRAALVAKLARKNNPATAQCLLDTLQSRGMCCANAPLPFCNGASLTTLAIDGCSESALRVFLSSTSRCPLFRGGVGDECCFGHIASANSTASTRRSKDATIEVNVTQLLESLNNSAQRRLLCAQRRLDSLRMVGNDGNASGHEHFPRAIIGIVGSNDHFDPLDAVLTLVRRSSQLIDLAVTVRDLVGRLAINRCPENRTQEGQHEGISCVCSAVKVTDEASLQKFITRLRTAPLATVWSTIQALKASWNSAYSWDVDCLLEGLGSPNQGDAWNEGNEGNESSLILWYNWFKAFEALCGSNGAAIGEWIVSLQDYSLLSISPRLSAWLAVLKDDKLLGGAESRDEWLGKAEDVMAEMLRAEEEVDEVSRLRTVVLDNLVEYQKRSNTLESYVSASVLPLMCLEGWEVQRALQDHLGINKENKEKQDGSSSFGVLLESVYSAMLGNKSYDHLHELRHSSKSAYLAKFINSLLHSHQHQTLTSNAACAQAENQSLDTALRQLEASVNEEIVKKRPAFKSSQVTMWTAQLKLQQDKTIIHLAVAARAVWMRRVLILNSKSTQVSIVPAPLLAAVRSKSPFIVQALVDSRMFQYFQAAEFSNLDSTLCIAAAASGNPKTMEHVLRLIRTAAKSKRHALLGWSTIHAALTGAESLPLALANNSIITDTGLAVGSPGMVQPSGIWSIGSWAKLHHQSPGLNFGRMKTLEMCLDISEFFCLDDLIATHTSASFLPNVLDIAASGGYCGAVMHMLRAGILDSLARSKTITQKDPFLYFHAAALNVQPDVFLYHEEYFHKASSDAGPEINAYPRLRLLLALVNSVRTFRKMFSLQEVNSPTRKKKWRAALSAEAVARAKEIEHFSAASTLVPMNAMIGAETSEMTGKPRVTYRHSVLHDAIISGNENLVIQVMNLTEEVYAKALYSPQELDMSGYCNTSLLLYAVNYNHVKVVKRLLDSPWKLNCELGGLLPFLGLDKFIWTPLQLAAYKRHPRCLAALLHGKSYPAETLHSSLSLAVRVGADECAALIMIVLLMSECPLPEYLIQQESASLLIRGCSTHNMWRFQAVLLSQPINTPKFVSLLIAAGINAQQHFPPGPLTDFGDVAILRSAFSEAIQRGHGNVALLLSKHSSLVLSALDDLHAADKSESTLCHLKAGDLVESPPSPMEEHPSPSLPAHKEQGMEKQVTLKLAPSIFIKDKNGKLVLIKGARTWDSANRK